MFYILYGNENEKRFPNSVTTPVVNFFEFCLFKTENEIVNTIENHIVFRRRAFFFYILSTDTLLHFNNGYGVYFNERREQQYSVRKPTAANITRFDLLPAYNYIFL